MTARDWDSLGYNDLRSIIVTLDKLTAVQSGVMKAMQAKLDAATSLIDDAPRSTDNTDGTTTWHGVPVTIPTGLVPAGEAPCEVRSMKLSFEGSRWIGNVPTVNNGNGSKGRDQEYGGALRLILASPAPPVTWQAPASLPDGENWAWDGHHLLCPPWQNSTARTMIHVREVFRDWIDPPQPGRYRVTNGVGVRIGDA